MPFIAITHYRGQWNTLTNTGRINIELIDGSTPDLNVGSAQEFSAILQILSKENVGYDRSIGVLDIAPRPVG